MTKQQKGQLIGIIVTTLGFQAKNLKKQFDEGDIFFSLAFKTDKELLRIAKLAGV